MSRFSIYSQWLLELRKRAICKRFRAEKKIECTPSNGTLYLSTCLWRDHYLSEKMKMVIRNSVLPDPFSLIYDENRVTLQKEVFGSSLREEIASFSLFAERILLQLLEKEEEEFLTFKDLP